MSVGTFFGLLNGIAGVEAWRFVQANRGEAMEAMDEIETQREQERVEQMERRAAGALSAARRRHER